MEYEVVVSGGGVVGLCAAIAMAQRGYSVVILDGGEFDVPVKEDFRRVYAINTASQRLLTALGVWDCLEIAQCAPYRQMEVCDQSSTGRIAFDCRSLAMPELGHIIGEITLKKALLAAATQETHLNFLANQSIQRLASSAEGMELHTQSHSLKTSLLMVAEGARSTTRELLNVPMHQYSYHQQALVAQVACEHPHGQVARQIFLPSGPLAFLPLPDSHQCSIVWSTRPAHAEHLKTIAEDAFNAQLAEAFDHQLGKVALMGGRYCFPLHMRHVRQYSGEHWLLLGDTAHTIHPLAGLGLNLGLADVQTWLDCITSASEKGFSRQSLAAFQRQRKTEVWKVIMMMQGLKSLFQNPLPPFIHLRAMGLNTVNRLSPIKRFLMKQATGL